MAVFTCKRCGGTLEIKEGERIAKCLYCGTLQTLPNLDDEKRANLYDRASHFRRNNEYDKAMSIYEKILEEDPNDAEAYWSILLCRFGVEYVEDPKTHERIPTINRMQKLSILADEDYKQVLKLASSEQKDVYIHDAEEIARIQKGILDISSKEEPFDVFICYKETDERGMRTIDSVLAQDLYKELTKEGLKVFFSRITLEDKLGVAYEPYIFAALNSAKVMVAVGTRREHFNAVWVRNEWSRYLALVNAGENKTLIPAYKDMDPYDLPDELLPLQAQDMAKIGFMQDLVRGIKKIVGVDEKRNKAAVMTGNTNTIMKRAEVLLKEGNFEEADRCVERVLDIDFENANAYLLKLLASERVKSVEELASLDKPLSEDTNYEKIIKYAESDLRKKIEDINNSIIAKIEHENALKYKSAEDAFNSDDLDGAIAIFGELGEYKDAVQREKDTRHEKVYRELQLKNSSATTIESIDECIKLTETIKGYKDVDELLTQLVARKKKVTARFKRKKIITIAVVAIIVFAIFMTIIGTKVIAPNIRRGEAEKLVIAGDYDAAYKIYEEMRDDIAKSNIKDVKSIKENGISEWNNAFQGLCSRADVTMKYAISEELAQYNYVKITSDGYYIFARCDGQIWQPMKPHADFMQWDVEKIDVIIDAVTWRVTFTVTPVFDLREHNITYNYVGGIGVDNPITYNEGEKTNVGTATRRGYRFVGWEGSFFDGVRTEVIIPKDSFQDVELTAVWTANTYNVVLVNDVTGSRITREVIFDKMADLPILTSGEVGYEFAGWYDGDVKVDPDKWSIPYDVELHAKWRLKKCKITLNSIEISAINVKYVNEYGATPTVRYVEGEAIEPSYLPPTYIENHQYCFGGWYTKDGTRFAFDGEVHTDLELTARWLKDYGTYYDDSNNNVLINKSYTGEATRLLYVPNSDGKYTINVDVGSMEICLVDQEKEDEVLIGSVEAGIPYDIELEAGKLYSLKAVNGSGKRTVSVTAPETAEHSAIVAVGEDIKAQYSEGKNDVYRVKYGEEYNLTTPVRKGYTFVGWLMNGNTIASSGRWTYANDVALDAKWTPNVYHVTFDVNGGTMSDSDMDVTYDSEVTLPSPTIDKIGYTFGGWYNGTDKVNDGKWTIDHDVTLVAKWTPKKYDVTLTDVSVKNLTVKFLAPLYDAENPIIRNYRLGETIEYFDPNVKHGSVDYNGGNLHIGWYKEKDCINRFDFNVPVSRDIELWSKTRSIKDPYHIVDIGTTYKTKGGDHIYVAKHSSLITVTVEGADKNIAIYDNGEFDVHGSELRRGEGKIDFQAEAGKFYYISTKYNQDVSITLTSSEAFESKAIVVTAEGEDGCTYAQGSHEVQSMTFGSAYNLFSPTRMGYTFDGWYIDQNGDKTYDAGDTALAVSGEWNIDQDVVLVSKWRANTYTAMLDVNGGNEVPSSITVTFGEMPALPVPTHSDNALEFAGWYDGSLRVDGHIWQAPQDVALTAKWQTKRSIVTLNDTDYYGINVTYIGNNILDNTNITRTYKTGERIEYIVLDDHFVNYQNQYFFMGWFTDPLCNNRFNFDTTVTEDLTLYAGWKSISYVTQVKRLFNHSDGSYDADYFFYMPLADGTLSIFTPSKWIFVESPDHVGLGEGKKESNYTLNVTKNNFYIINAGLPHEPTHIKIDNTGEFVNNAVVEAPHDKQYIYANGNTATYDLVMNSEYTLPTPHRRGYVFDGWYENGTLLKTSGTWTREDEFELVPHYHAASYNLTLDVGAGSMSEPASSEVTFGEAFALPTPTRTGYTFGGWYNGVTKVESGKWTYDHKMTLVAKWIAKEYTNVFKSVKADSIKVDYNMEDSAAIDNVKYSDSFRIGDKVKFYHVKDMTTSSGGAYVRLFQGWYYDDAFIKRFNYDTPVYGDIELYAKFVNYPFYSGIGNADYYNDIRNNSLYNVYVPKTNMTATFSSTNGKVTLYKVLEFHDGGAENSRLDKELIGVFDENNSLTVDVTQESVYYMQRSVPSELQTIFIDDLSDDEISNAYAMNGTDKEIRYASGTNESYNIKYGESYNLIAPVREGYTFEGWYDGAVENGNKVLMSGAWAYDRGIVFNAKWTANKYHVTFDAKGGTMSESTSQNIEYDSMQTLPKPTRTGYDFAGWYDEDTKVTDGAWTIDHNASLVAHWTPHQHKVTFKDTNLKTVTVTYNAPHLFAMPKVKTYLVGDKIDYIDGNKDNEYLYDNHNSTQIFAGWYRENECINRFNFDEPVTQDMELYAKFVAPDPEYGIYVPMDSKTTSIHYNFIFAPETDTIVTLTHSGKTSAISVREQSATGYGNYTTLCSYRERTFTFNAKAGNIYTVIAPDMQDNTLQIESTTKFVNRSVVALGAGEKESQYASGSDKVLSVAYGSTFNMFEPERAGYTFDGWYIDNGNGSYDSSDELLVDAAHLENYTWNTDRPVTLVAKWK